MALNVPYPASIRLLTCHMTDISDNTAPADVAYVPIPWRCRVLEVGVILHAAITGSNSTVLTYSVHNGTATALTGGSISAVVSGSAAGSKFTATPQLQHTTLLEGDAIGFVSDGASSTTVAATCYALVDLMGV